MSYWNGTDWVETETLDRPRGSRRSGRASVALLLVGAAALVLPFASTLAAPRHASPAPCEVSVAATQVGETFWLSTAGLPTGIAINLWTTDADGTSGSPLGSTTDGTFHFQVSADVVGTTSYAFAGPTKKNTTVYSTCSVEVR